VLLLRSQHSRQRQLLLKLLPLLLHTALQPLPTRQQQMQQASHWCLDVPQQLLLQVRLETAAAGSPPV
jgi:hypothetical protein